MKTLKRMLVVGGVIGLVVAVVMALMIHSAFAQTESERPGTEAKKVTEVNSPYFMAVVIGAALAAGFGFLGGGYAVAKVGAAALGAAAERPELLTRSIVLVALGEGIAVFGFVVALMMLRVLPA